VDLADGAAEHGEVLARDEHAPAVDRAVAGDDAVAWWTVPLHPEVVGPVDGERVGLLEREGIEKQVDAFARGELALLVLLSDRVLASPVVERGPALAELLDPLLDRAGARFRRRSFLGRGHRLSLCSRPESSAAPGADALEALLGARESAGDDEALGIGERAQDLVGRLGRVGTYSYHPWAWRPRRRKRRRRERRPSSSRRRSAGRWTG
jgi:hypothetical protein